VFAPQLENDEIKTWDKHWENRLFQAQMSGQFYEHHTDGKRWLYEQVVDVIEEAAGGTLDGKIVAELGVGSGYATLRMADRGALPLVIDGSRSAIRYSQKIANYLGLNESATFICRPLLSNEKLGPFDVTFNSGVLEHYPLDVARRMLKEMIKATSPGGTVVVILPNLFAPVLLARMIRSRSKGSERFYTPWLLKHLIREAGLTDIRTGFINAIMPVETPLNVLRATDRIHLEKWAGVLSALFYSKGTLP